MIFTATLLIAFGVSTMHAQDDEEDLGELILERPPYFGLGAGYMRMLTLVDYEEMNIVSRAMELGDFSGMFHMDIAGLTFTPGIIQNIRVGLYAGTGSTQLTRQIKLSNDTLYTRTLYFTSVIGAIQTDYAFGFTSSFTVFPGIMLGAGRHTIGASQTRTTGTRFHDVFHNELFRGDTSTNVSNLNRFGRALSYNLFIYPTLNLEYTLTPNIMARAGVGYNTSIRLTDWADEGGVILADPPNIGVNGVSFQLGLFVGLFQH